MNFKGSDLDHDIEMGKN